MLLLRPVEWEGSKHPGLRQMSKLMQVLESINGLPQGWQGLSPKVCGGSSVVSRDAGLGWREGERLCLTS